MAELTDADRRAGNHPVVRLTLENLHLRAELAHAKDQIADYETTINDVASIVNAIYSNPARQPTQEERRIAQLFRTSCDDESPDPTPPA